MKTNSIMRIIKSAVLYGLAISISFSFSCKSTSSTQKPLEIAGTGACEDILKKLAQAYNKTNPGYEVVVPPSIGSGRGIKAVGDDEFILGRVARPLKPSEVSLGLSYVVFAKDMVIFVTGDKIGITSLTEQQLADIFSGKVTNWKEVGGTNSPIRVLVREEGDSSRTIIEDRFESFKNLKISEQAKMAYHDYEMVELLCKYQTAIGYLTYSSVNPDICPIAVDGIAPTADNVSQAMYPLVAEYAFIYKQKRLDERAKRFIDFIFSEQGTAILKFNRALYVARK